MYLSIYPYLSVCLSHYLSVYLSVCLCQVSVAFLHMSMSVLKFVLVLYIHGKISFIFSLTVTQTKVRLGDSREFRAPRG